MCRTEFQSHDVEFILLTSPFCINDTEHNMEMNNKSSDNLQWPDVTSFFTFLTQTALFCQVCFLFCIANHYILLIAISVDLKFIKH